MQEGLYSMHITQRHGKIVPASLTALSAVTGDTSALVTAGGEALEGIRTNRAVWIIFVAVAVVIALGLATAWFIYCQSSGGWPALDMPALNTGGTWKLYCTD